MIGWIACILCFGHYHSYQAASFEKEESACKAQLVPFQEGLFNPPQSFPEFHSESSQFSSQSRSEIFSCNFQSNVNRCEDFTMALPFLQASQQRHCRLLWTMWATLGAMSRHGVCLLPVMGERWAEAAFSFSETVACDAQTAFAHATIQTWRCSTQIYQEEESQGEGKVSSHASRRSSLEQAYSTDWNKLFAECNKRRSSDCGGPQDEDSVSGFEEEAYYRMSPQHLRKQTPRPCMQPWPNMDKLARSCKN